MLITPGLCQVAKSVITCEHRHSTNVGKSFIVGLGDYSDGQLWSEDVPSPLSIHAAAGGSFFDGRRLHKPMSFTGDRFTIIAYVHGRAHMCTQDDRQVLHDLGFTMLPLHQTLCELKARKPR